MPLQIHPVRLPLSIAYLLANKQGLYLIDAGAPGDGPRILRAMTRLGRHDLRLIWISHAHLDHYGAAAAIRRDNGAPIAVHTADAGTLARGDTPLGNCRGRGKLLSPLMPLIKRLFPLPPTEPDIILQDGDTLTGYGLNAALLHTPGHTPGSSCLLTGQDDAFVGDLLSHTISCHLQHLFAHNWDQLPLSLCRLNQHQPDRLYAGHGPQQPMPGSALDRLIHRHPLT